MECERDQHPKGFGETHNAEKGLPTIFYNYFKTFPHSVPVQTLRLN